MKETAKVSASEHFSGLISEQATSDASDEKAKRAARQAASDFALASVRLDGFILDASALDLHRRYIEGVITTEQMRLETLKNIADKNSRKPQ